ncbi:hypothetical protein J4E80_008590 [Alternaria sp. BMP 0032]|nr:hypothetical protein J4E80_008590 [Alternaria sp. BMP 0032]
MDDMELTIGLREALNDQMDETKKRNGLPHRGGYISDRFVKQLFTRERLLHQLQLHPPTQSLQDPTELADFIETRARKIFAILLLIDKTHLIIGLQNREPKLDDHSLFDIFNQEASSTHCRLERLQHLPELGDVAEEIYKMQWVFPVVLSSAVHFEFDPKFFKFPFKDQPERIGSGGFGDVRRVIFEGSYLKGLDGHDENGVVAYKKIRLKSQRRADVDGVMKEMKFLRSRRHDNILPLMASFTAGIEMVTNPEDMTRCLYLVFPLAEMSMHEWFNQEPDCMKTYDHNEFYQDVLDAMRGLISGLAYIHRKINYEVGYHGDIKPRNILKFGSQRKLAWKICDFGASNLKPWDDTATRNVASTRYWAPKEFSEDTLEVWNHGRSHDVWSLGCIFLLLTTMLVHGWSPSGLKAFERLRAEGRTEEMSHAFCNSIKQITEWIATLRGRDKIVGRLLDLIQEMLKPREGRIFSWEVDVDLFSIAISGKSREDVFRHLKDVIQEARDEDKELTHNPMTRARNANRSKKYRKTLLENGWSDGLTTEEEKRACAVERSVSTLPTLETEVLIADMEHIFQQITQQYQKKNSLALVGLRGVGKSLAALHYAHGSSWRGSSATEDVFWVRANSLEDFHDSYTAIAASFKTEDPQFSSREKLCNFVKSHLENSTKKWLMVVDGFDGPATQDMRRFLPSKNGKILYTTRNTHLVDKLVDKTQESPLIEMQPPDPERAMALFRTYVDKALIEEDSTYAESLLQEFNWPEMIRRISRDMNDRKMTCRQMCKRLEKERYTTTERLLPNLAEQLLIPTLGASLRYEDQWSDEISVLVLLCLFDNTRGLDSKLIRVEYSELKPGILDTWLKKLVDCCFVRIQSTGRPHPVYLVEMTVNLAVRTWMATNDTPQIKLKRYSTLLSMLFSSYTSSKKAELNKRKSKASRAHKSFASFKEALMPHFNRFVEFAKENPEPISFSLYDSAVQAVSQFSDVLIHEDRFEDAIKVLEFTKRHFKLEDCSKLEEEDNKRKGDGKGKGENEQADEKSRRRRRGLYFQLAESLTMAYLSRPKDGQSLRYLGKAKALVEDLERKVASSDDTVIWEGRSLRAWKLGHQMVRVLWKSGEFDKAWTAFKEVSRISVKLEDNEAVLQQSGDDDYHSDDKQEMRKLAIRMKREESLLNFAHGDKLESNGRNRMAMKRWKAAYGACLDLRKALRQWFPTDDTLMDENDDDEAKILVRLGSTENLNDAAAFLERVLEALSKEGEHANVQRTCDFECRLNEIRLKRRDEGDLDNAKKSLDKWREVIKDSLGKKHDLTLYCVRLSFEACHAMGNGEEARNLETEFGKQSCPEKHPRWIGRLERREREYLDYFLGVVAFVTVVSTLLWVSRFRQRP